MNPSHPRRSTFRVVSSVTVLCLSATVLGAVATPSQAAAPVTVQLLNINDFHGRIDANTTKFATTVENLRAGNPNTLFLSAGDNIGASLFASSSQQDEPTLDVLDALGLQSSAVGNHEFDKGAADLVGRVSDRADFALLGANVYDKGTTTPALEEYALHEVGGITVGVIGVVTQETTTAVSPDGIADLDFGDPVEAVNRVAGRLTDGDDGNGEADLVVAEYHEGADAGAPASDLSAEVAKGGAFADIVTDTSPAVDVIFTGHTHATYAWDAPVPGTPSTRPIVQTGSYGANIGQVELTYDPATDTVTTYSRANVARVATADTTLPRVATVKTIVDAAISRSVEIGNTVVGTQVGDVTTAFTGGAYSGPGGTYVGGTRDDRASESTLGNLVAQALLEGVSNGEPDLAVTNPGGLRAELRFAGDTSTYPANTDGVITLAEAASVLPFANTVSLVELSGAALDQLFEQQWPTGSRTTTLRLGVSDNVRVTADPTRPAGDRVTSIRLGGELVDPAGTYTVSTLNFLAGGGDGFSAFTQGTSTDVGLLDLDLFAAQLREDSPVRPDFARQQVDVTGTLPATVSAGARVDVDLSGLDLTSQGSPANSQVVAYAVDGDTYRRLASFPVSGGAAQVAMDVPDDLDGKPRLALIAEPSHTLVGAELPQVASTTTATVPAELVLGAAWTVTATVDSELVPSGTARLLDGDDEIAAAEVTGGAATFSLAGDELAVGTHQMTVAYDGDGAVAPSTSAATTVTVTDPSATPTPTPTPTPTETPTQTPTPTPLPVPPVIGPVAPEVRLVVRVAPRRIVARQTRARVEVVLRADSGRSTVSDRRVTVKVGGRTYRSGLDDGRTTVRLRAFARSGIRWVRVGYWDDVRRERVTSKVKLRVRR